MCIPACGSGNALLECHSEWRSPSSAAPGSHQSSDRPRVYRWRLSVVVSDSIVLRRLYRGTFKTERDRISVHFQKAQVEVL